MSWLLRWLGRILLALVLVIAGLLSPLAYIETMCRPHGTPAAYEPLLPPEWQRPDGRTPLT